MMLRCTLCCRALPKVERRKRKGQPTRPGLPDLPKSAGGYFFRQLRPYLPIVWQYGWRWKLLQGLWLGTAFSFAGYLIYVIYFRDSDEVIAAKAAKYTYVRNEQGEVVDIGYKPIIDASRRAQRRARRLLEDDDDE
ncbi:hypothetical protein TraAM80_09286 [Trypanosoma rangeli]|uniref:Uncharacterized protein n=1 Tax=Trypanosoma rangeli TaxID=5698 RepID=A0A422MWH1_TRYRA|nr:uncharacterized protein TraAM80_09286 [Trypanosoma rangeli]RNE97529.1 hypothetical protein TraAM80_09286 [Trypanosoma rangeli]|eukprot:RNE97529.1 hypothetical protein TraAM80_09286 [Trypanosoma rangeli]